MAKQTNQLINDTKRDLLDIERRLESAKQARDRLSKEIRNARTRLNRKKTDKNIPEKTAIAIIREMFQLNVFLGRVIKAIDEATDINTEFSHPAYLSALYRAANRKEIYKTFRTGTGWDSSIDVEIVFEEVAGDLNDWAEGILGYREELGVEEAEPEKNRGQRATFYWLGKVFGTAKEATTVRGRIRNSDRLAPFWRILDSGSQPLLSDRDDGSFNPIPATPTGFVQDAELSLERHFKLRMEDERKVWQTEVKELEAEIERAESLRDSYDDDIKQLKPEAAANRKIYDSLGEKKKYVDEDRLEKAVRKARAGEGFETKTIELTKRGSDVRTRISARRLEGLL